MALREIITRDLRWKILSLTLAVVIWVTVNPLSKGPTNPANPLPTTETRPFTNLPVLVISGAADAREIKVDPEFVTVTVRGQPDLILAMTGKEIRVMVDLTGIEAARGLLKRVEVSVPPGVAFMNVEPPQVNVIMPPKRE